MFEITAIARTEASRLPSGKRLIDRRARPLPTVDEIRQRAATIRDSWSPKDERKRRAWSGSRWELPRIAISVPE